MRKTHTILELLRERGKKGLPRDTRVSVIVPS